MVVCGPARLQESTEEFLCKVCEKSETDNDFHHRVEIKSSKSSVTWLLGQYTADKIEFNRES